MVQKDQHWLWEMGPPTPIDWAFLSLVLVGLVALAVLLVTYLLI